MFLFTLFLSTRTNDKGLFKLGSMFVVPGRSAGYVDGTCAGAEQWRFCFTQSAALPARGADRGEEPVQRIFTTSTRPKKRRELLYYKIHSYRDLQTSATLPVEIWNNYTVRHLLVDFSILFLCGSIKELLCLTNPTQQQQLNQWGEVGAGQSLCPTNGIQEVCLVYDLCEINIYIFILSH